MNKQATRSGRGFAVFLVGALSMAAAASTALAQASTRVTWSNEPTPPAARGSAANPFTLHWAGITPLNGSYQNNWKIPLNFGPVPIRQDVKVLYSQFLGKWPHEGVHRLLLEPNLRADHLAAVRTNSAVFVNVPDWDGLIAIDMEQWYPVWERYPENMKSLFRDAVARVRPQVVAGKTGSAREDAIKAEFQTVVKDLYLSTMSELRRGWPKAKISWLGVPMMLYGGDRFVPAGQGGYGDTLPSNASRLNDQVQWLMDAQDYVCAYTGNWAIAVNPPEVADYSKCTAPADWNYKATVSNIKEAVRLAKGKPVYGFCGSRYGQSWGLATGKPMLRDLDLYQQFTAFMAEPTAAGIIYWDEHHSEPVVREWEGYLAGRFNTALRDVATRWNRALTPADQPNPLPNWSSVGSMARAGQIAPAAWTSGTDVSRFTTAVNAPRNAGSTVPVAPPAGSGSSTASTAGGAPSTPPTSTTVANAPGSAPKPTAGVGGVNGSSSGTQTASNAGSGSTPPPPSRPVATANKSTLVPKPTVGGVSGTTATTQATAVVTQRRSAPKP